MTTPHDLEPVKPNGWETVLAGKRLPVDDNSDDLEAEAIRQALLWRHTKRSTALITPQEAEVLYQFRRKTPSLLRQAQHKLGRGYKANRLQTDDSVSHLS